jgi:hypothetical protein
MTPAKWRWAGVLWSAIACARASSPVAPVADDPTVAHEDAVIRTVRRAAAIELAGVVPEASTRIRFSRDLGAVAYFLPNRPKAADALTAWMRVKDEREGRATWSEPIGPLVEGLSPVESAPCWSPDGAAVAIVKTLEPGPNQRAISMTVFDQAGKRRWSSLLPRPTIGDYFGGPTWGPGPGDVTLALSDRATEVWRFHEDVEPQRLFTLPPSQIMNPKAVWSGDGRVCCVQNEDRVSLRFDDGKVVDVIRNEPELGPPCRPWTPPQWSADGRKVLVANRGVAHVIDVERRTADPLPLEGKAVAALALPDEAHWLVIGRTVLKEEVSWQEAVRRGFESVPDRYTYFAVVFDREGRPVPPGRLFERADRGRTLDSRRELGMWTTTDWTFALLQQYVR